MQPKVIITCAVTGAGDTVGKSPNVPVTPEQIANSALEAASAGATVVHCHVRNPKTGKGSRDVNLYREVMERIRAKNTARRGCTPRGRRVDDTVATWRRTR